MRKIYLKTDRAKREYKIKQFKAGLEQIKNYTSSDPIKMKYVEELIKKQEQQLKCWLDEANI